MFGKQYANHLDVLLQSFGEISQEYKGKINNNNTFTKKLKKLYILIFGIPEIGFQIRSLYFKKIINSYLANRNFKKILDAGSGIGIYTLWLGKTFKNAKVIGIDIDREKLKSSQLIANKLVIKNVEFLNLDATELQDKSEYDFIINIDVLEHIGNYEMALKNFYSALKRGGYLYIHVPQSNQKRIFNSFKTWHHEDHVREGITKNDLEDSLRKLKFRIAISRETFGLFGKLSWELNHMMLSRNFILAGIFFPLLYVFAKIDLWNYNKNGLGIAILAKKQ